MTYDWSVLGVGAANIVLRLDPQSANDQWLAENVARARYAKGKAAKSMATYSWEHILHLVWGSLNTEPLARDQEFVQKYIVGTLGKYVSTGELLPVSEGMRKCIHDTGRALKCSIATILPNFSSLPAAFVIQDKVQLTVEIKTKCGFLPNSATIHPSRRDMKTFSRYSRHQKLKLKQGKIQCVSTYDPLDLFSSKPQDVRRALTAMLSNPQNNMSIFMNGTRIQVLQDVNPDGPSEHGSDAESDGTLDFDSLSDELQSVLQHIYTSSSSQGLLDCFIQSLMEILVEEEVLDDLLVLQKLDSFGVEAVHQLLHHMKYHLPLHSGNPEMDASVCSDPGTCAWFHAWLAEQPDAAEYPDLAADMAAWQQAHSDLSGLTWSQASEAIRNYMISVTAKDCCIMVTLQESPVLATGKSSSEACSEKTGNVKALKPDDLSHKDHTASVTPGRDSADKCKACLQSRMKLVEKIARRDDEADGIESQASGVQLVHTCCGFIKIKDENVGVCGNEGLLMYRIGVVDFDEKPLSKIDAHMALENAIAACCP